MPAGIVKQIWLKWLLALAFWTLIGLAFASQLYLAQSKIGYPVTWKFAVGGALADWYVFALLSLPAFWLARQFHLERANWPRGLVIHLAASAVFSLLWVVLRVGLEQLHLWSDAPPVPIGETFVASLVKTFYFNALLYWVFVSVRHAFDYYRKFQERAFRATELERRLTEAKLQALQMQLNPHFLFNTLHAISALMHKDVEAADRMIAQLSDLLRYALESTDAHEVPLAQELDFLRRYLEIEQTRFGERLTVRLDIAPDTLAARVPNLVLQPLVENAIRHGIEPHARPGRIELSARSEDGRLLLRVSDNGGGLADKQIPAEGVGLANTRARLQQLYGAAHRLEFIHPAGASGLIVSVTIPLRTTGPNNRKDASR